MFHGDARKIEQYHKHVDQCWYNFFKKITEKYGEKIRRTKKKLWKNYVVTTENFLTEKKRRLF